MKEILALIRINKINKTKKALSEAGITSFTATGNVLGHGQGMVDFQIIHGAEEGHPEAIDRLGDGPRLVPKRMLWVVVTDDKKDLVVKTIIEANQTGSQGDGKVFVLPVHDAVRVRTGESGDDILN